MKNGGSVLIIEDDNDVRETLIQALELEGYDVFGAANGKAALEQLRLKKPCVILLDLMMPIMNGWEFRLAQQAESELAHIPVVVISADGNVKSKAATISVTEYLKKPIELEVLLNTVKKYCS